MTLVAPALTVAPAHAADPPAAEAATAPAAERCPQPLRSWMEFPIEVSPADVDIALDPSDGFIGYVDGVPTLVGPIDGATVEITATAPGYASAIIRVRLSTREPIRVKLYPVDEPEASSERVKPSAVTIKAEPPADVRVNKRAVGRTPVSLSLKPGHYVIEYDHGDHKTTQFVGVRPNAAHTFEARGRPSPRLEAIIQSPSLQCLNKLGGIQWPEGDEMQRIKSELTFMCMGLTERSASRRSPKTPADVPRSAAPTAAD